MPPDVSQTCCCRILRCNDTRRLLLRNVRRARHIYKRGLIGVGFKFHVSTSSYLDIVYTQTTFGVFPSLSTECPKIEVTVVAEAGNLVIATAIILVAREGNLNAVAIIRLRISRLGFSAFMCWY
jgi:hypothetical protein